MREDKLKEKLLIIPNDKNMTLYSHNSFILPLENYSIGFDEYFNIEEINELSKEFNIYIMINKFFHNDEIQNIKNILDKLNNIKGFFIEDIGLSNIISKDKVILFQSHLINNYVMVNYLNKVNNINNFVISNDLTYKELALIREKTDSKLYYFLIGKNMIMYSKRKLVSNYLSNYKIESFTNKLVLHEKISKKKLIIKEEGNSSTVYNYKTFCGNKYLDIINEYDYLIVNFTLIDNEEKEIILKNMTNRNLYNLIDSDYYFLEEDIKYKVEDL